MSFWIPCWTSSRMTIRKRARGSSREIVKIRLRKSSFSQTRIALFTGNSEKVSEAHALPIPKVPEKREMMAMAALSELDDSVMMDFDNDDDSNNKIPTKKVKRTRNKPRERLQHTSNVVSDCFELEETLRSRMSLRFRRRRRRRRALRKLRKWKSTR